MPAEYAADPGGYLDLVCGPMLAACAPHARWVDVFCEDGAFGADEAAAVLAAGRSAGLIPRVHANQLGPGPGVQVAVAAGAASADHCTYLSDADVAALASSAVVATLLPGWSSPPGSQIPTRGACSTRVSRSRWPPTATPARASRPACRCASALGVREMRLTTEEAVWAATAGGARALRRTDVGHLAPGARADLVLLDAPSHTYLAYRPGVPLVSAVWQAGRLAWRAGRKPEWQGGRPAWPLG